MKTPFLPVIYDAPLAVSGAKYVAHRMPRLRMPRLQKFQKLHLASATVMYRTLLWKRCWSTLWVDHDQETGSCVEGS